MLSRGGFVVPFAVGSGRQTKVCTQGGDSAPNTCDWGVALGAAAVFELGQVAGEARSGDESRAAVRAMGVGILAEPGEVSSVNVLQSAGSSHLDGFNYLPIGCGSGAGAHFVIGMIGADVPGNFWVNGNDEFRDLFKFFRRVIESRDH
jgi:hypothetical protein